MKDKYLIILRQLWRAYHRVEKGGCSDGLRLSTVLRTGLRLRQTRAAQLFGAAQNALARPGEPRGTGGFGQIPDIRARAIVANAGGREIPCTVKFRDEVAVRALSGTAMVLR